VQCLAALGLTGRYVMINSQNEGHVTCEAWSDTWGKWIMLDPYFGRRVTLDGVPLNVYEIHALPLDPLAAVRARVEQSGSDDIRGKEREFYLSLFRTFAVRMRNDWFTNRFPHWYPLSNSVMNAVEWQDRLTFDNIYYKYETGRLPDLYWPLDQVRLELYPLSGKRFRVTLETFTPNFANFQVELDSAAVITLERPVYDWSLHSGRNDLRVRAVNSFGRAGRAAGLSIRIKDE
jgi:hypothetical protein